jgi:hypothetical protein
MDAKQIPARPHLEQYRKQAKDLLKDCRSSQPKALRRLRNLPLTLAGAQLAIAREHGFESWPKFAKHIEAVTAGSSVISRFESAADAVIGGDIATLRSLLHDDRDLVRARSTRKHS